MSASNHNYVCFDCRYAIRHPKTAPVAPKCKNCGAECYCLGYKVAIPKRDNIKSWGEIAEESRRRDILYEHNSTLQTVHRQHFVEREIQRLQQKEENRDRSRAIKKLLEELDKLNTIKMQNKSQ